MLIESFSQYETEASKTAVYPYRGMNITYATLGLCGESGEVAEKVKKLIRDNGGTITEEFQMAMRKELGDVLWYLAAVAYECRITLTSIATENINKLKSRQDRDVLHGNGDNR